MTLGWPYWYLVGLLAALGTAQTVSCITQVITSSQSLALVHTVVFYYGENNGCLLQSFFCSLQSIPNLKIHPFVQLSQ